MKVCKKCNREFPDEHFFLYGQRLYTLCQECEKQRHREKRIKYYWANPQPFRDKANQWNKSNREKALENNRSMRERDKKEVLEHYGGTPPTCACCGETERRFLCIDHIVSGSGKKERDENRGGGHHNYRYLKKMGFPSGNIRVLCYNCNCGRERNKGICPHQEK